MQTRRGVLRIVVFCWMIFASVEARVARAEAAELTERINERIASQLAAESIAPAPPVDDATYLRRVSLDLIGRTPTVEEIEEFLADPTADKRARLVDRLLATAEHAHHFARTWRALLIPESNTDPQVRYFVPGFEAWLYERRMQRAGFDAIVRELITAPITGTKDRPQLVLTDLKAPNPIAFYACKNASAAELAATATRLFLGVRMECAQCHDHPFDSWTQQQFWNQAAFFAGIERKGRGAFAPILEDCATTTIRMADSDVTVAAAFLDGDAPELAGEQSPRIAFADWIVSPANEMFAQAIANRVWGELMGIGLVDPVDDFHAGNPPSHPELLAELAAGFRESGFDLDVLYHSICASDAYQRSSERDADSPEHARLYAYRVIKPMTGEQFYDSFAQALAIDGAKGIVERSNNARRRRVVDMFATHGNTRDPETSVVQTLALMNGEMTHNAASALARRVLDDDRVTESQRIEHLYMRILSRPPTDAERSYCEEYLAAEGDSARDERLADLVWALLNSAEFRWNH